MMDRVECFLELFERFDALTFHEQDEKTWKALLHQQKFMSAVVEPVYLPDLIGLPIQDRFKARLLASLCTSHTDLLTTVWSVDGLVRGEPRTSLGQYPRAKDVPCHLLELTRCLLETSYVDFASLGIWKDKHLQFHTEVMDRLIEERTPLPGYLPLQDFIQVAVHASEDPRSHTQFWQWMWRMKTPIAWKRLVLHTLRPLIAEDTDVSVFLVTKLLSMLSPYRFPGDFVDEMECWLSLPHVRKVLAPHEKLFSRFLSRMAGPNARDVRDQLAELFLLYDVQESGIEDVTMLFHERGPDMEQWHRRIIWLAALKPENGTAQTCVAHLKQRGRYQFDARLFETHRKYFDLIDALSVEPPR